LLPIVLVLLVRSALPVAWEGFMQNVRQTPFLTGFRMPHLGETLKVVRSVPGIILIVFLPPLSRFKPAQDGAVAVIRRFQLALLPVLIVALGITLASLSIISANTAGIASYMQPLLIGVYLAISSVLFAGRSRLQLQVGCLCVAIVFGAMRAVGMSTWGVACATDVGYSKSNQLVASQLAALKPGSTVVMSSAFLYNAVKHSDLNFIHSDWLAKAGGDSRASDLNGLLKIRPQEMVLTEFDYYRRFKPVLDDVKTNPAVLDLQITNTAKIPTPDSLKKYQHIVQHVSWAPVIVKFSWRD